MKTPQEYYAIARSMFLSAHPDFQAALDDLKQEDADAMNMSLPQYRSMQADRLYASFLRARNQDAILFSIQLAEPDKEIAMQAIECYLKEHAAALGMTWEAFCEKNQL
ncbi:MULTISPECIES: DUF6388 family protein [Mixta]|uniref:Host-nuclease inhibitor protein Gam n=1 Tax=Mixta calida TaxID=665913 RepID=A0ABM6S380_9GAMM|nr:MULTISPECIES: DUF6388 family protein [Mixta]AIX73347.1 hypothetical protein PSNIH2_05870 [Pantoea sp. PSNIH2]MDU3814757.1 DUF6388 family protein [Pantoea sp.]POU40766.1 hypothetical protein C3380_23225 [Pantoea sp. PSNIH5]POU59064.1 hypothetical protein C3374_22930 [Pantoea sp. PSNIH4]POY65345.1 hypothetical protein C3402_23935 [Pantoea sp. PSNIH3]HCW46668.1 hypothetical protein [Erwiniaceae bacterium]